MPGDADVAAVAALIGDQARAAMLLALLGGTALPASELATAAGVSRSTASFHLDKLRAGGLVVLDTQNGRHRYYRLVGADVAEAVEALQRLAPAQPVRSLRTARAGDRLRTARFCYDHLAGRLAIQLVDALTGAGTLAYGGDDFAVTDHGKARFADLGIDVAGLRRARRSFARGCLDWTERRHHVAGALGAAIAHCLIDLGWIRQTPGSRAVRVTPDGQHGLATAFGIQS